MVKNTHSYLLTRKIMCLIYFSNFEASVIINELYQHCKLYHHVINTCCRDSLWGHVENWQCWNGEWLHTDLHFPVISTAIFVLEDIPILSFKFFAFLNTLQQRSLQTSFNACVVSLLLIDVLIGLLITRHVVYLLLPTATSVSWVRASSVQLVWPQPSG